MISNLAIHYDKTNDKSTASINLKGRSFKAPNVETAFVSDFTLVRVIISHCGR